MDDRWEVAGRSFTSRLIVGTGKYKDFAQNAAALEASDDCSRPSPLSPVSHFCSNARWNSPASRP